MLKPAPLGVTAAVSADHSSRDRAVDPLSAVAPCRSTARQPKSRPNCLRTTKWVDEHHHDRALLLPRRLMMWISRMTNATLRHSRGQRPPTPPAPPAREGSPPFGRRPGRRVGGPPLIFHPALVCPLPFPPGAKQRRPQQQRRRKAPSPVSESRLEQDPDQPYWHLLLLLLCKLLHLRSFGAPLRRRQGTPLSVQVAPGRAERGRDRLPQEQAPFPSGRNHHQNDVRLRPASHAATKDPLRWTARTTNSAKGSCC